MIIGMSSATTVEITAILNCLMLLCITYYIVLKASRLPDICWMESRMCFQFRLFLFFIIGFS